MSGCSKQQDSTTEDTESTEESIKAQRLTSMKLSGIKTGLLINVNVQWLADGIERFKL